MPLLSGLKNIGGRDVDADMDESRSPSDEYGTVELTAEDVQALADATPDRDSIAVRPNMDNSGVDGMLDVLEGMHTTTKSSTVEDESGVPAHAYELAYRKPPNGGERSVSINYYAGNDDTHGPLRRQLNRYYPDSKIDETPARYLDVTEGKYLAGANLGVRLYTLYPIKNIESDTFRSDPTGSIIQELAGSEQIGGEDASVLSQTMFRPEPREWLTGVENGDGVNEEGFRAQGSGGQVIPGMGVRDMSETLKSTWEEPRIVNPLIPSWWPRWMVPESSIEYVTHEPTKADIRAANLLEELDSKGWSLWFRIFAVADSPELAIDRVENTAQMYKNFYEFSTEQTFVALPLSGDQLRTEFLRGASREFHDGGIVKSNVEVGGLVNVPESDDVASSKMKWSLSKAGEGTPSGTPRADWEALAIDPRTATKEQIQVALLGIDDFTRWYGLGAKHGVEAGIKPGELMNPHKFIVGTSGAGKTTLLAQDASQQFDEPGGGLRIDPNGDDTRDVLAEWPEDRPREDLIYIDLSGDYDRIPRFNFLEIPDYLDTDSREFETYVQGLAEKCLEMVGMAGGTEDFVGGLMARVMMNVVRAMGKLGVPATLFDVAAVCSSGENLEQFAEHMPRHRLKYLRQRVFQLADLDDRELDPLAGRLDDWVLNENIRELICAREPTFSISDAVADGKEIVLRFAEEAPDREKMMAANPLMTRTYHAQRHHHPDTQPFELVVDEAQDILSSVSDVVSMLDQGRKYDYRVTLACQGTSQFDNTDILKAILRNVRTIMLFKVGTEEEVSHAIERLDGVDANDVVKQDKFHFFMSTETESGSDTPGYQVEAFRSPREARVMAAEAAGENPDTTEDEIEERTDELIEFALDKWGITKEELGEPENLFDGDVEIDDGAGGAQTAQSAESDLSEDEQVRETVRAVHEEWLTGALEAGESGDTWVDSESESMINRMARYVDPSISDATQLSEHYMRADGQGYIDLRQEDGTRQARVTDKGFTKIWERADEGKEDHRKLIADTHALLIARHMQTEIATGPNMPDFTVSLSEDYRLSTAGMETGEQLEAIREHEKRLEREAPVAYHCTRGNKMHGEAESSTAGGRQTVINLGKAYQAGKRAMFVCRPSKTSRVLRALADPPLCKDETNGTITLYNHSQKLTKDGVTPVVLNSDSVTWKHDPAIGQWAIENDSGSIVATFESHDDIYDLSEWPVGETVETTETLPDESYATGGPHMTVAVPVTTERYFGDTWNSVQSDISDSYVVVEVPRNARREPWKEGYIVTDDGDKVPFSSIGQGGAGADEPDESGGSTDEDGASPDELDGLKF